MTAPVNQVQAHSTVEIENSCNCTNCCPRVFTCCWGRRIKPRKQNESLSLPPHLQKVLKEELAPPNKLEDNSQITL